MKLAFSGLQARMAAPVFLALVVLMGSAVGSLWRVGDAPVKLRCERCGSFDVTSRAPRPRAGLPAVYTCNSCRHETHGDLRSAPAR